MCRNTEYNIGTDTDTQSMIPNDFFSLSLNFSRRQRISMIYMSDRASDTILTTHEKCCPCQLEIAVNYCLTRSFFTLPSLTHRSVEYRLKNTKLNALEALKYIDRLGIGCIWSQEDI